MQKAIFAAGCFWGIEAAFRRIQGVVKTEVGYSGGKLENPTYEDVCTGQTGHAEVVAIEYDESQVTYEELLEVFWNIHDPTTLNRQGPDIGTQYRSAIFYLDANQQSLAQTLKENQQQTGKFANEIVTEITPALQFHMAEDYHQQYLEKRGLTQCP
ncbi:MAG: peptide-methionine (S)-S-oxide reductase MsrA [Nitrospinota bacterium]|nr:peptide-methionine (S)-S-oxide reductase MsrA [Nitrospinota bacterium]